MKILRIAGYGSLGLDCGKISKTAHMCISKGRINQKRQRKLPFKTLDFDVIKEA